MEVFNFKRFDVINERSSMKVNSDGILLGAASTVLPKTTNVLDIGTGTGTIALMIAQRLADSKEEFHITGIDIDEPSAEESKENFSNSPWSGHMESVLCSLQEYKPSVKFDLIVSNPPYYDSTLVAPEARRNSARHRSVESQSGDETLDFDQIMQFCEDNLSDTGILSLILPTETLPSVKKAAKKARLYLYRILMIKTTETKAPKRMVIEFCRYPDTQPIEETLTLMKKGKRTDEYISLTEDFYIR